MSKKGTGQRHAAAGEAARAIDLKAIGRGRRALDVVPQTYDQAERTVDLILSEGSAVQRWYGTEVLSTDETCVVTDRLRSSGIPFLDSHMTGSLGAVVGRLIDVWFTEGRIFGRARFAETEAGKMAEGMVARGEIKGISIGYRVDTWEIRDGDGTVIDPETTILNLDDTLTFTATRWELLEASLVSVPADPAAMVRSNKSADEPDLRASPMGRGAREITVTHGESSVTYRYGADAPQERAWPETTKGKPMAKHNAVRADDDLKDDGSTKPKDDTARKSRKRDEDTKTDDAKGDETCDDKRDAEPLVDDDGNYVDEDGNYVDADGEPSDEPVSADRDMDGTDDDDEGDRKARGKRSVIMNPTAAAPNKRQMAELVRIGEQARAQGVTVDVAAAIERGMKPDALRAEVFDELAKRSRKSAVKGSSSARTEVTRDENEGKRDAMELALVSRVLASRGGDAIDYAPRRKADQKWVEKHAERAQDFMGMSFVEIAAECIGHKGNIRNSRLAVDIIERAFQSTSDFPAIFQNVLNKSLLARYELAEPTYKLISIERQFNDFRPHPQVRSGEFPMLQPVTQTGEIVAGNSTDSGESITLVPYGVVFPISRQMIVNDELGAIDQILGSSGDAVRLFENVTFFAMFNANPVLNQDGQAVFSTNHKNLAGTPGVISVTTVGAGRAALRSMKSLSGYLLNVPPRIILTGPSQETYADQLVASITPQLTTSVNPFSGKLKSVSDANIVDNSWHLLADPNQVPCYVHGFLNGSNGPRVRTYEPFGTQGVKVSLEHDFAVGAIDFRGAYRNPGALPSS